MKVNKSKLEKFTEEAVVLAGRAMSMLYMTRCPIEKEFAAVDRFVEEAQKLRQELGLPEVELEVFYTGERPRKKGPLGFQLPESDDGEGTTVPSVQRV